MDNFIHYREYIVIIDKRSDCVLDYNGHSVSPAYYDNDRYMTFWSREDAENTLKEECEAEELDINNYRVGKIRVGYSIVE